MTPVIVDSNGTGGFNTGDGSGGAVGDGSGSNSGGGGGGGGGGDDSATRVALRCSIEGNIGAGKTTVLNALRQRLGGLENFAVQFVDEPLREWQNVGGQHNLLDMYYRDPARWAYTFQTFAFLNRVEHQRKHPIDTSDMALFERSVLTDACFAHANHAQGSLSDVEMSLYEHIRAWLVRTFPRDTSMDLVIYLHVPAATCLERVHSRHRSEEASVSIDYLSLLEVAHDTLLAKHVAADKLVRVDASQPIDTVVDEVETVLRRALGGEQRVCNVQ